MNIVEKLNVAAKTPAAAATIPVQDLTEAADAIVTLRVALEDVVIAIERDFDGNMKRLSTKAYRDALAILNAFG